MLFDDDIYEVEEIEDPKKEPWHIKLINFFIGIHNFIWIFIVGYVFINIKVMIMCLIKRNKIRKNMSPELTYKWVEILYMSTVLEVFSIDYNNISKLLLEYKEA